ncbi:MAG: hypothetical protein Q8M15_08665, partial [Bacteroidota bacterium]|nr:hypothetical protein [Bacteroidota bacterium]
MYPAIYRWAYAAGREKDLLTEEQQKIIPKQTKWNWRNVSKDDVFHLEQELLIRDQLDTLIEKEDLDWFKKKRLFLNIAKLHFSTINLLGKENYERLLSLKKEDFVKMIEQFSSFFPKQSLLKWFHINSA